MTKNPFINALCAVLYVASISMFIFYAPHIEDRYFGPMAPVAFLSLFVFSAGLMSYIVMYQPLQLLLQHKPAEATKLFLTTLFTFAAVAALMVGAVLVLY